MTILTQQEKSSRLLEIEGLRAIAVIAVIINHYFDQSLPSGFLGVDVFFVISGFVITKYLTESQFSNWRDFLLQFYARRIKRLFPALIFCVVLTCYAFLELTTRPPTDVFKSAASSLLGFSNVFLFLSSTDYFSLDAKLNPFTHTWSLGVEEQFYLLFPFLLGISGFVKISDRARKNKVSLFIILILLSFSTWIWFSYSSPSAQFYLLPSRIWELAAGGFCYISKYSRHYAQRFAIRYLSATALLLVLAIFFSPAPWQTFSTIVCVLATALLVLSIQPGHLTFKILSHKYFVRIGVLSYSLYLWHWSILVLGKWTVGETFVAKIFCLVLMGVFSLISFFLVESPLRKLKISQNFLVIVSGVAFATCGAIFITKYFPARALDDNNKLAKIFQVKVVPEWGNIECHGRDRTSKFAEPLEHCLGVVRTLSQPNVVYLIGDSHAAQLYWMAERVFAGTSYQLKFVNLEDDIPSALMGNSPSGSKTLKYVTDHAQSGDILLMSIHRGQFNAQRDRHVPLKEEVVPNERTTNFVKAVTPYFRQLEHHQVKIVLINDTPLMQVVSSSSACALQIKLFGESICRVSKKQDLHTRGREDMAYTMLRKSISIISIWDPAVSIYGDKDAIDVLDAHQQYVMQDWHHITQYQSLLLAPAFLAFIKTIVVLQKSPAMPRLDKSRAGAMS